MKLTVLTDNNTFIDHYYCGEPALSFYIENQGEAILFDTGYSDVFINNAMQMGIDLSAPSILVLSHGHNDHTGGLSYLYDKHWLANKHIIAHPEVFNEREENGLAIGSPVTDKLLTKNTRLTLSKDPVRINEHFTFLGEIPAFFDFEKRKAIGTLKTGEETTADYVKDDSALVYKGKEGLFIITGCSHSGICNIIEYAKDTCKDNRVQGVIGGFHLFDTSRQLTETIRYFEKNKIPHIYPCHCVSFPAKAEMYKSLPLQEVGVGLAIEIA